MEPEKLLKNYVASIEVPDSVKPDAVRDTILQDNELTAGTFLKSLRQLKISGSQFLDLLGNSRIGNSEYRYIEENPHLRFDELLAVLDNSVLTSEDYRVLLAAATHRKKLRDERRRREQEAVARLERDRALAQITAAAGEAPIEDVPVEAAPTEVALVENVPTEVPSAEAAPIEETLAEEVSAEVAPVEETPVEEVTVEEVPVEDTPAEEIPADEILAEETPAEVAPVEETPAEVAPAEETPVEVAPIEEIPAEVAAVEVAPIEEAPAEVAPADEIPAEEIPAPTDIISEIGDMFIGAPAEAVPTEEVPVEVAPIEETPTEEIHADEIPAEEIPAPTDIISEIGDMLIGVPAEVEPVEEAPAEGTPAEVAPAEVASAEEISAEEELTAATPAPSDIISEIGDMLIGVPTAELPVEEATAEEVPAQVEPVEEVSAEVAPAEEVTVEEVPIEDTPAEEIPADEIPAEETPAEEELTAATPTDIISEISDMLVGVPAVEGVPAEETPVEVAPVDETPVEEVTVEEVPIDETPTEVAPVEETTAEGTPTQDVPAEESEEEWEYDEYENDSFYDDDDYSAKSLARSVGELVEKREERSKNCLIAAFSLAAAVLVFGVGFKLLKYFQVLPTYTYEIPAAPEEFSQQITDYKELFECARTPDEAVSYLSAAESPSRAEHTYEQSKTAFSPKYVLRVCDNGKGKLIIKGGSINDKGKVESKFTADVFDDDITDLNIFYKEYDGKGYFILTAPNAEETCVKIYEQDALRQLKDPMVDYRQSGAMLDYYIGEDAFYPISYIEFDADKANSGKPETFIPHIYNNDRSTAAAFNDIVLPYAAGRLNFYVVSRLPLKGGNDCFVKAPAVGENSGWATSTAGLYISDTVKVNGDTHTRLTRICFDKSLTPSQYDLDGKVYPEMIAAGENKTAVLGKGAENTSVLYVFPSELSEPSAVDNIAENKPISDLFCEGDILSVITSEEKPMQYSLDLNTLKSCEPADNSLIFIKDGLYAKTEVSDKGVTLSVCIDKNTELASVEISEKGGSGYRLPSNADAVVTGISGDNVIIGVPVVYYDGVTDVGKFRFYTYKDKKLSQLGEIIVMEGDLSFITGAVTDGGYIVTVWGSRVITADSAKVKIISDASL